MVDLLPYFTIGGIVVAVIVGLFQIKESFKKRSEESDKKIINLVTTAKEEIVEKLDNKLKTVETEIAQNKEDIEDVEDDMKRMVEDWRKMCETLSKHNYIIEDLKPRFDSLKTEFYKFKTAVDINLLSKKADDSLNL
jgi:hypothetical protein